MSVFIRFSRPSPEIGHRASGRRGMARAEQELGHLMEPYPEADADIPAHRMAKLAITADQQPATCR